MTEKIQLIIERVTDRGAFKTILLDIDAGRDDQNTVWTFLFIFLSPLDDFIGIKIV